jgi:hypothetical protein
MAAERDWRGLQVVGPLPFEMVGVLSSLAEPLADAGVGILAVSTFETDLILVREESFQAACRALVGAGHTLLEAQQPARTPKPHTSNYKANKSALGD